MVNMFEICQNTLVYNKCAYNPDITKRNGSVRAHKLFIVIYRYDAHISGTLFFSDLTRNSIRIRKPTLIREGEHIAENSGIY